MPREKIIVEFKPEGDKQLTAAIKALSNAQIKLINSQKGVSKSAESSAKSQLKLARAQNDSAQTQLDLAKLQEKERMATIKGADAKRANRNQMLQEDAARKKTLASLKEDIINRNKSRIATEKLSESFRKTKNSTDAQTSANNKLSRSQKLVSHRMSRNTESANILNNAFATLRNQLLLLSFAMATGVRPITNLINAQSKATETASKFDVVFGKQASSVRNWAENLGSSVGRATSTLQEMLSSLQDTFVPLGFSRSRAAQFSTTLTKLAIDVASFNNKADADVVRDFQSAIVGNHETVKKYGIIISEARIKTEALASGITDNVKEMTEQEKVLARLNLLMAGSNDAIGDAERTSGEYANTLKAFNEELKKSAELMGEKLMPAATDLLQAMTRLLQHVQDNPEIFRSMAIALGALAFTMGGTALVGRGLLTVFGKIAKLTPHIVFAATAVKVDKLAQSAKKADNSLANLNEVMRHVRTAERYQSAIEALGDEIDEFEKNQRAKLFGTSDEIKNSDKLIKQIQNEAEAQEIRNKSIREKILTQQEGMKVGLVWKKGIRMNTEQLKMQWRQEDELAEVQRERSILIAQRATAEGDELKQLSSKISKLNVYEQILIANHEIEGKIYQQRKANQGVEADNIKQIARRNEIMTEANMLWSGFSNIVSQHFANQEANRAREMQQLKASDEYDKMSRKQREIAVINLEEKQRQQRIKQFKAQKLMNVAQIGMDTATAVMSIWAQTPKFDFGLSAAALTKMVIALGAVQAGFVMAQNPSFATGGLVGGRRHAQGGTTIEAERGEYVMRRQAVESIGVENLNRMNEGGRGGDVQISISGNVMSQDFIEGELREQIIESVKRGMNYS